MSDNGNIGTLVRSRLWFDEGFTQVPNTWTRDARLSWGARGLLTWMVGHRPGFEITILGISAAGTQGKDAVRGYVGELERAGYLKRYRRRTKGRIDGTVWHLFDPHAPVDNHSPLPVDLEPLSVKIGQNPSSAPESGFPTAVEPTAVEPTTENPTTKEDQSQEELKDSLEPTTDRARKGICRGRSNGQPCDGQGKPWCDFCGKPL